MTTQYHIWELPTQDIGGPFNARAMSSPGDAEVAAAMRSYLSLNDAGIPLTRSAFPPNLPEEPESNWEVADYVEVPTLKKDIPLIL